MYDIAGKYIFCFHDDPKIDAEASLLLVVLETYINGAIIQLNRLNRTRKTIDYNLKELISSRSIGRIKKDFNLTRLHCDYHFYFICIGQIHKLIETIGEVLEDQGIKKVLAKFDREFPIEIRDHLEHIHERAQGKKYKKDIGHISDFGNFVGNGFTFAGKSYTVDAKSLTNLKLIYKELINVITTNYASKDSNFIWREQSDEFYAKLRKKMKREGII